MCLKDFFMIQLSDIRLRLKSSETKQSLVKINLGNEILFIGDLI